MNERRKGKGAYNSVTPAKAGVHKINRSAAKPRTLWIPAVYARLLPRRGDDDYITFSRPLALGGYPCYILKDGEV